MYNNISCVNFKLYVISTYSGLEHHVRNNLLERIKSESLEHLFGKIIIPVKKTVTARNGINLVKVQRCFPGYILIELYLNEKTWLLIKKTPKVVGFVGNPLSPPSLNIKETKYINDIIESNVFLNKSVYKIGEHVRIKKGPFMNVRGVIEKINIKREKIKLMVSLFGRLTPIELDFSYIDKII